MAKFNVYRHPLRGFEAVKVGFSWPAFFFGFFWMLVCHLWTYAIVWFVFSAIALSVELALSRHQVVIETIVLGGYFALWLIPAFRGNSWRAENLVSRGFAVISQVEAETADAALAFAATGAHQGAAADASKGSSPADRIWYALWLGILLLTLIVGIGLSIWG